MSRFVFHLTYKEVMILKHSLEQRIEMNKNEYNRLKGLECEFITEEEKSFIREHEEHLKCLESYVESMQCCGYMHGSNVFGEKYLT